ncbi:MAG: ParB/RepB/Spo0J family partition protein [Gemmataceae bacterium]|nr:ParB/RepB/Spo0J family partition protein [Gemmataceae bacterium]
MNEIRPLTFNDHLYRPISPDDPGIRDLADDVRKRGLLEPLVLTQDYYIISGHRRRVACLLADVKVVPCRISDLHSTDPRLPQWVAAANKQRVKSLDEVLREQAILPADPEEAHRVLTEFRKQASRVKRDEGLIELGERKDRSQISEAKTPFLKAILKVLEDHEDFWPLSVRQIHYYLLNDPPLIHASKPQSRYANDQKSYKALDELLTRARLERSVPFEAIHDPTRPVEAWRFPRNVGEFMRHEMKHFLKGYYRDLQQSQPNHLEIIGEKNTVQSIIRPVAEAFCIPYTLGRGYSSLPPRHAMVQRFRRSGKEQLVLLVVSDFDPEGEDIARSFPQSLRDDFGVQNIMPIKAALTDTQVTELRLPPMMKAKESSSRHRQFTARHGDNVFELEAVPPAQLQAMLRQTIDSVMSVEAFNAEVQSEKDDAAYLEGVRRKVQAALEASLDDQADDDDAAD